MTEFNRGNSRTVRCECGTPFCLAEGKLCDCTDEATEEEIDEIKDTLCEACHGRWLFDETDCPSTCEAFARELEELRNERA